ncbi:MAG: hypothetical protein ACTSPY_13440 [Candidatus Helarchaeota archaeon]
MPKIPKKKEKRKNNKKNIIYNEYPKCPNCGNDLLFIRKFKHKIKKIWMIEFICGERSCPHINLIIPEENIHFDLNNYKQENPKIAEGFSTKLKKVEDQINKIISGSNNKICDHCGYANPIDGLYCVSCGNKLK